MIETGIVSKVKIQDVLSNQLPNFIRDESPDTIDFLKQYYISQEYQGGPSDISDNLDQYLNIDNLTPEVIVDTSTTVGITTIGGKIINVTSTKGFPNQYGLLKIDDEIVTYTGITKNSFIGCKRGFSGITSYHADASKEDLVFSSSSAAEHADSSTVQNLSSLFLKEFYKKFKSTFLPGLEEINFQSNLDVGTFIGESRSLYQTKGTEESFRILFNVLYGITPKLINLEERLIKPSFAKYVRRRVCVAELIEGNPIKLKGQSLLKGLAGQTLFRSDLDLDINAAISEIEPFERSGSGVSGITTYYKIGLFVGYDETSDVEGDFVIVPNTKSLEAVSAGSSIISVDSTIGFGVTGTLISGSNIINYTDKTVNQFLGCTATNENSFNNVIEPTANIRSNITYFGFEDGDLDRKVVLRLTGVLSEFEQEGDLDVEEGEIISVKSIGDKVENPKQNNSYKEIFCNSWIYNTSSSYFIGFGTEISKGKFNLLSETDPSSLKIGDFVEIVERESNEIIDTGDAFVSIINDNDVTLSGGEFSGLGIGTDYKLRKKLNKASSSGTPIEFGNDAIISDIQNVYIEGENAYVSSNSLPSFINNNSAKFSKQINVNIKQISLDLRDPTFNPLSGDTDDQIDFSNITFNTDVPFNTGDKVFYTFSNGDSLVGLSTGAYFIEKITTKKIKLYRSPSGIADGKNITFSRSNNSGIIKLVLFSQKSAEIGAQKLIKKFPLNNNLSNGNNVLTPVGQIGMLKNGVEISNYKSEDKMFFGPLTEVNVLNEGENFDVINPPIISISSGVGATALVQPVVSGKIEDVFIDTQVFDIDKIISIGVTGGNGSGCILEPVVGTRFREELFDAKPTTSGGGISTIVSGVTPTSTIRFDRNHNFVNSEPIIYDSNLNPEIIIGTGTSTLINQSIYYPEIVNSQTIKLYESLSDLSSGIGTIQFYGNSSGNHIFKVGLRNTLLNVNVIDGGKNYTNRNLLVKPSGISTVNNKINFTNHGFSHGDLVNYSTVVGLGSTTPQLINGLSTSLSYYILKDDDNSFRLADAGVDGRITTNFERNKNVSLGSTGTGYQSFSYPDIKVLVEFNPIGIGTSSVVRTINATPKVRGTIQQTYLYESGTGYGSTIINNHKKPIITVKNGKNASIKPIIVNGRIDSVIINYVGQEYFSSPDLDVIDPTGLGAGAKLRPIIANGQITDVEIINAGIGYSTSTSVNVKSAGQNAFFDSNVRELTLNKQDKDTIELLEKSNNKLKYSFTGYSTSLLGHKELIGWAYDGNPIYGSFGSSDPQQKSDLTTRLEPGYTEDINNIVDRPPNFDAGHFIEDFKYDNSIGDLDEHNGRYEVTKEFPNGVYAYHATIDDVGKPKFPYFIGNSFRSTPISFNFDNNLQTSFDFISNNLIRNTFPYKVADDFAENDFIIETNEIQDQKIEINSISSGSVTGFDIISGGSGYKVNEFLEFDNQDTEGDGLISFISEISGKNIQSIDTNIEKNNNSVITWSENQISVFTNSNHNLKNNDIVTISGLSTDISSLNNSFKIGVTTFTTTTLSTITASPSAGFTTEIFVSNIPSSIAVGSSIGIGTETLKVLNIYKNLNILTIQRDINDLAFGTIHPEGSKVEYLTNKFTINKSILKFDSKVNQKVFFNPKKAIGLGVNDGEASEVTFSFAGQEIKRNIPTKQIFIENHPFKTNQKIKFTRPDSTQISISTESSSSQFNLPSAPEFLYVVNKTPNTIGIKTGIGNDFNEVYFRNINSADSDLYQFETTFDQVIGDIESIKTTITTTEPHELQNNDQITLDLKPNLSVGIGTSSHVNVSKDSLTDTILFNPIGFNSTGINTSSNTITIQKHGLQTGDKIKYESDLLPQGLENKNYFIYKIDDNNIKLCETLIDVKKNIPTVIGIGSTGGNIQSISLINPNIQSIKNNDLVFDLSDSSLTGYEFKIYYDQEYKNDFVSSGESSIFNISTSVSNGSVGAALTIGYGSSIPDVLYYNLEKGGTVSATDTEVKKYSEISFVNSPYKGSYNVSNTTNNSFVIFLNNKPEKLSHNASGCDVLAYTTNSKTAKGSINSIKILSGGSNYKKLPDFIKVKNSSTGKDAVIIPTSSSIGNVNKVRIINEGFEYSSDQTLKPESLIASSVNIINTETLGIVSVTNGGSNYVEAPDLIIVNTDTGEQIETGFLEPKMLENSILSVNITELPIGLPEKTVTLRTINNTNGIVITDVISNGSGIFTCRIATPNPVFATDPFSVGDKVFIEGIEKVGTDGSGFNSADYGYKLLTVMKYDANVNAQGQVGISVTEFGSTNTGIAVTSVETFSTIINESDYPTFFVTQNQSKFDIGEKLIRNSIPTNFTVNRISSGKLKILGKEKLKVGDILLGENSGSRCEISKIVENKGKFKTNFSILKNLNWDDNVGKLDEDFQVVADNDYYQNLSYSIQSPIEWQTLRTQVNNLLHTSGMKNFADTEVVSTSPVGVGSTSDVNLIVDLISEKRVDEIKDIDLVRDVDVVGDSSRFIQFKNIRLSDFIRCDTNDVLVIDNIQRQFSNFQGTFNDFIDILELPDDNSTELFNDFLIITKDPSTSSSLEKIQLSNLLVLGNGSKNILVQKSDIINSGIGFTNSEINNFVNFNLVGNSLRFEPNVDLDLTNERDYDLKIFSTKFNTNSVGVGTSSIGPIDLSSRVQICTTGITTNIITVPTDKFESLYATLHIIDDSTKEMNLVESFISHSNTNTYLSEAYFNTDGNDLSLNQLGIITSNISGDNLILSFENNGSNTLKIKSKIIGIGTTGIENQTYRFKAPGQLDGFERSSFYTGVTTSNIGISTIVDLNSDLFNAVKSIVEVSIGSSKAIHEVLSIHDGTNAYAQQSGSLSITKDNITNYDPSSGLGTFGATLSGSNYKLIFHPDDSSGISTVVSLNHCFYVFTDFDNVPDNLNYGVITESHSTESYNSIVGNRINRTQFTLKNNSIPIFGKTFNPSNTTNLDLSTGKFTIDNHFFRENEQLVYKPASTFVGVGSTPMEFKNGSIIDQLPTTVFAKSVTNNSFFISTTRAGTAVTFVGLGEGNAHELSMAKANEKSLITVDGVTQYPLIRSNVTHTLDSNDGQIGLTTTILHLSGISTISSEDILKVNDEFMKVVNIGFAEGYGGIVGSSGTFNTVEVERSFVGTSATTHSNGDTVNVFRGSYNISGQDIFFTQAPRGNPGNLKNENNLNFATSDFNGRVYLRNDYSSNVVYDDISDQFTGIKSDFILKLNGSDKVGLGTTGGSGVLFINGIFQSPSTEFNPNKNYIIEDNATGGAGGANISNGGSGYTASDGSANGTRLNVNTTGGSGASLTVDITVTGGVVSLVGISTVGTGYKVEDEITITGGGGNAKFIIPSITNAVGISTIIFTGITSSDGSTFISNNINTNELPRGGVTISIGNTVNGLGYAPLVGANVKPLFNSSGEITSIVGVAYSGSDLEVQNAVYNGSTGIMSIRTKNEHKFKNSNDFVLINSIGFSPSLTLKTSEFEVVSVGATNIFNISVGKTDTTFNYTGSGSTAGEAYPFFPNLTFGSGYNGLSPIGVAVTDLGYEHRFVSANTNAISGSLTPTNAVYNPVTGILQLTVANHGLTNASNVTIADRSIFFTCSRDNFRTVHPYPRPTDPASGASLSVTNVTANTFEVNVGVNVGSGAQVSAVAGVGGTAIFTIDDDGSNYKDPQIFVSQPSYSNLSVRGVSRLGIGPTTETGTGLRVNAIVKPVTGIGSTLFEVSGYEIVNRGFGYKKGDVVEAVGLVTAKEMGELDERSTLTIDQIYNDSFALWQFGDFDYIDSIKTQQDGSQKNFSLELNNQLVSVEVGNSLNENVDIENIFLVVVNGVIQEPKISYNIVGGTIISFVEPPIPEDDITILFYRGTAEQDSEVNLKQKLIIEEGDKIQITQGSGVVEQDERTVFSLDTSKKLETNAYLGNGISESVDRPLSLIKQKEDRIINKSLVSKKRSSIEPRITPTAKIISDVKTSGIFYVDDATLFEYETKDNNPNDNLIDLSINSRDQIDFVNASATANIGIGTTVLSISIGIAGTGYDSAPTVKLSAPPLIGVGVGTTATAETTIGVGGTVTGINITNPGLGYTIAPKVLISSPVDYSTTHENITSAVIKNAFGVVTGIGTTTLDGKLAIKFELEKDDTLGSFTPVFPGSTDNRPVYISDTRIGTGVTSLSISGNDNDVYAIGESFLDNIYAQASFSITDNVNVGVLTCFIKSDTDTTGLTSTGSKSQPVGKFSVSRVMTLTRASNPISIGITGRTVGSTTGLSTFPTLKRTGGSLTFEQSGAIIPED